MVLKRISRNFGISILVILISIIYVFSTFESVYACPTAEKTKINFVARDSASKFLSNIKWNLYLQEKDADGNHILGKSLKSGTIGDTGKDTLTFDPDTYDVGEARANFAIKLYEFNANVGEFIVWNKQYSCNSEYTETSTLSSMKVVLRNVDGASLKNKKFDVYEQKSDREGNVILGELVAKDLSTGDFGEKKLRVGPGKYILKVSSDIGASYQRSDVVINSGAETVVDYTLSNVSVVVRDGNGNLLTDNKFNIYKQIINTDGVKVLGAKVGSYTTGTTGQKSIYLPTDTYVMTFSGTGTNLIYLWDQIINETVSYDLSYRLSTIAVTARGFDNELLSKIAVKIYEQTKNIDGSILLGNVVASGNTGTNGSVQFYIPAGRYAIELTGPDSQKNIYYNNDLFDRSISNTEKILSALKIVLKDADGNLLFDVPVSLVEQLQDAQGEFFSGKVLKTKNTQKIGITEFYYPPAKYALKIKGTTNEYYYFWDKEIEDGQASVTSLTLSVIRIAARDTEGKLVKNVSASLYNQDYDLANEAILGSRLATVNTGDEGFADILVPEGTYIVKAGDSTNFNLVVKPSFLTTVNLSIKGDAVQIESISSPRPAVSRANNSLLRSGSTGKVYVLLNGQLRYISSTDIFAKYGYKWGDVLNVSQEELDSYEVGDDLGVSAGTIIEGSVVKASDSPTVYLIDGGKKRPFNSGQVFLGLGHKWSDIITVSIQSLANLADGELMEFVASARDIREGSLVKASDSPAVYLVENGKKRSFTSGQAFESRGYKWNEILVLSAAIIKEYEEGPPLVYMSNDEAVKEGSLIKAENSPIVYLISNNRRRPVASERIFLALGFEWESVLTVSAVKVNEYSQDLSIDFTAEDPDRDGLSNLQEEFYGTDPNDDDSDDDGFIDGREVNNGFNPLGGERL